MMGWAVKLRIITAVLLCFAAVTTQHLTTFSATYDPFYIRNRNLFQLQNSAVYSREVVQLTPLFGDLSSTSNLSGRVMLKQRFKLWEQGYNKTSGRVASFNSSFLFHIGPFDNYGEGLAFVLAPDTDIPSNSFGQYLGLTNNFDTDGSPENQFVAIEFDNFKEDFDPNANHMGLNINSVISNTTVSLTPLGIEIASGVDFYNVWDQYDGVNKVIEVYIAAVESLQEITSRPDTPVLKSNLDLSDVLDQYSYFGFFTSTGDLVQSNNVFWWNLTVDSYLDDAPGVATEGRHPSWEKTLVVVGVGFPLLMMGAALTGYYYLHKKRSMAQSKSNVLLGTLKRLPGTPREFQFKNLKKATNNFDEQK